MPGKHQYMNRPAQMLHGPNARNSARNVMTIKVCTTWPPQATAKVDGASTTEGAEPLTRLRSAGGGTMITKVTAAHVIGFGSKLTVRDGHLRPILHWARGRHAEGGSRKARLKVGSPTVAKQRRGQPHRLRPRHSSTEHAAAACAIIFRFNLEIGFFL